MLSEAVEKYSPAQLRHICFANMLIFCCPSDPQRLWDSFKEFFAEDISHRSGNLESSVASACETIETIIDSPYALAEHIRRPTALPTRVVDKDIWLEDFVDHSQVGSEMYDMLSNEQKYAANCGSGKTFLYEALNHIFKAKGFAVRNVAWSGIAAQLLPRG